MIERQSRRLDLRSGIHCESTLNHERKLLIGERAVDHQGLPELRIGIVMERI